MLYFIHTVYIFFQIHKQNHVFKYKMKSFYFVTITFYRLEMFEQQQDTIGYLKNK